MMIDSKAAEASQTAQPIPPPPPQYQTNNGPSPSSYIPPNPGMPSPQIMMQPVPPPTTTARSAAQIGEEYRAALFAQCAQGIHEPKTKYGPCGIITAVMCFPCGLICLFSDSEQRCARCGVNLSKK